jgi:hypothetical protein
MAKLRERKDGSYYVVVFCGTDHSLDKDLFGTWQLSGRGIDFLNQHNIYHDGDFIPTALFRDLKSNRMVWNEGSKSAPRHCRSIRKVTRSSRYKKQLTHAGAHNG